MVNDLFAWSPPGEHHKTARRHLKACRALLAISWQWLGAFPFHHNVLGTSTRALCAPRRSIRELVLTVARLNKHLMGVGVSKVLIYAQLFPHTRFRHLIRPERNFSRLFAAFWSGAGEKSRMEPLLKRRKEKRAVIQALSRRARLLMALNCSLNGP